jgi:hypothetical protein
MKTITRLRPFLFFFSCWIVFTAGAQSPVIINNLCLGGSLDDLPSRLVEVNGLPAIKYIIPGNSTSSNGDLNGNLGANDAWLVGVDNTYNIVFSDNAGGTAADFATDAFTDALGEISVIGQSYSAQFGNHGGGDILLYKRSPSGTKTSHKCIGGSLDDKGIRLLFNSSANKYIALANIRSTDGDIATLTHHGQSDIGVFELDPSFNITNSFLIGSSGFDLVKDAYLDNNDLWILGETDGSDYDFSGTTPYGSDDIVVMKYNVTNWSSLATYRYGGSDTEHGYRIDFNPGYGYYITGTTRSPNFGTSALGQSDGFAMKCDLSGNAQWVKSLSGSDEDAVVSGKFSSVFPGTYFVTGHTLSSDGDFIGQFLAAWKCFVAALDEQNGDLLWLIKYGGSSNDFADDVMETASGNLLTLNHTSSNDEDVAGINHGLTDTWLVEMSNPTSVSEAGHYAPEVMLFPNPANSELQVQFAGNRNTTASFEITDVTGRSYLSGTVPLPGNRLDVSALKNGIYFIRLQTEDRITNRRFIIRR